MYNKVIYELIKMFLEDVIGLDAFLEKLVYAGLGARVCYSSDDIQTLISKDERLNGDNKEKLIDFLEGLYNKGHGSIFEQAVVIINVNEKVEKKYEELKQDDDKLIAYLKTNKIGLSLEFLNEVFSAVFTTMNVLSNGNINIDFIRLAETSRFLTLTDWDIRRIIENKNNDKGYYLDYVKTYDIANTMYITMLIKFIHPYGINFDFSDPHNLKILINLRAYLELYQMLVRCDKVNAPQYPFDYFRENIDKIKSIDKEQPFPIKRTSYGANVWIINKDKDFPFIQFIVEGVSRIMTHQFVRHRLASFEERSFRYTRAETNKDIEEVFMIPPLDYIDSEEVREEIKNLYKEKFTNDLEVYNNLVGGFTYKIDDDTEQLVKVKREDARYILPDSKRTTIMCNMHSKGLFNFLHLRTSEHAQWEIREVARIIEKELNLDDTKNKEG